MCGIIGIISKDQLSEEAIGLTQKATATLSKRGPDASGFQHFGKVAFGHRRLSIIDTSSAANQPFNDLSGRYFIIFNGEIYNYKALRNDLIKEGYTFQTESDTEVLLTAYICYGKPFLNKLNGFFALAIYDKYEQNVLIARDRFGIKPLLIYTDENRLIFASEMKALLAYNINKELDQSSIYTVRAWTLFDCFR